MIEIVKKLTSKNNNNNTVVAPELKRAVIKCIQTDSRKTYQSETHTIKLHPLRSAMGHIDTVIAIDSDHSDEHLDVSICMILAAARTLRCNHSR